MFNPFPQTPLYTPSARDLIRDLSAGSAKVRPLAPVAAAPSAAAQPAQPSPVSDKEIEQFYHSPEIEALKLQICDLGRRLW